jgi:exodeoxyribonuclease V alpha subunit
MMKHPSENQTQEALAGLVERVTYHNVENGFCVLRAKALGHRDVVTVVGHAAAIAAGEWITASGEWVNDRTHGQQFKARFPRTSPPTSADGIEKYLSSGMIRGIGPAYARKLLRAFGEKVFDIIEATPDRRDAPSTRQRQTGKVGGPLTQLMRKKDRRRRLRNAASGGAGVRTDQTGTRLPPVFCCAASRKYVPSGP